MERIEETPFSNDTMIHICPSRKTVVVEEHRQGNVIAYKEISTIDLYYSLFSGYIDKNFVNSGFLPDHCLGVSMCGAERIFYLWNPELRADIIYMDMEYPDFPIPRLVFGVRILESGRVGDCTLGVVEDERPSPETPMYHYPFSNVYADGKVCVGNNIMPRYRDPRKLWQFPSYLLGLPNNNDFYLVENNQLKLDYQELIEHLKDKEPSYYYSKVLVPNGKKLQDFICGR